MPAAAALDANSGLPTNLGLALQPRRYNVGQTVHLPLRMENKKWSFTWFEQVTFRGSNRSLLRDAEVALDPQDDKPGDRGPLSLRDCSLVDVSRVVLGPGSSVRGIAAQNSNAHGDSRHSTDLILDVGSFSQISNETVLEGLVGFENVRLKTQESLRGHVVRTSDISARRIFYGLQSSDDALLDGFHAGECLIISGRRAKGTIVVDRPGQVILFSVPAPMVKIEQRFPAYVVSEVNSPTVGELECLTSLMRRKPDDSEGLYLHPHNTAAVDFLRDTGSFVFPAEYEVDREVTVDDRGLALALSLHPNP